MRIDHVHLARLDLNLLVALDALLTERSVTRAAGRIGMSLRGDAAGGLASSPGRAEAAE